MLSLESGANIQFCWLKLAIGHISDPFFPNMGQITKTHRAYMIGITKEFYLRQKMLLSTSVLFLEIGTNVQFC